MFYYYLICYYLTIKMKSMNERIRKLNKSKILLNFRPVYDFMRSTNKIYSEIDEYNRNYWSIYLFWFCILFIAIISVILFVRIFTRMLIMKILFLVISSIFISGLIIIVRSASSLNIEANKSYKLFYSLMFSKRNKRFPKCFQFKVFKFLIIFSEDILL